MPTLAPTGCVCKLLQEHTQGCLHRDGHWVAAIVLRAEIHQNLSKHSSARLQVLSRLQEFQDSYIRQILLVHLLSMWGDGFLVLPTLLPSQNTPYKLIFKKILFEEFEN